MKRFILLGLAAAAALAGCEASSPAVENMTIAADPAPAPPSVASYEIVVLEYALAKEITRILQSIVMPGSMARIVPDTRTNSVVLSGNPEELAQFKDVIAELDRKMP